MLCPQLEGTPTEKHLPHNKTVVAEWTRLLRRHFFGIHIQSMRRKTKGEKETRARGDVGTPSSRSNDQWVDPTIAAFVSTPLVERARMREPNAGIPRSKSAVETKAGTDSTALVEHI